MRRLVVSSLVIVLCAAGAAGAQTASTPAPAPAVAPGSTPSLAETVAARKAAFGLSAVAFGALNAQAQATDVNPQQLAFGAAALSHWAKALPTLFPEGTSATDMPGETAALPAIWANRADFEAKAAAYAAATDTLSGLSGDVTGYRAQLEVVNETCRSCHGVYRMRRG